MRQIETRWAAGELLPAIILFGHRRMGKTSILRNIERLATPGTVSVYLDMQDAALVDQTEEVLLEIAQALHRHLAQTDIDTGSSLATNDYRSLGSARRALNQLLDHLDPQMAEGRRLILALDEFEHLEDGIQDGRIDPKLLSYLRALNQRHRWLAIIFGGLHTLEEMGRDYQSAFYAQAENIRVSYLSREDSIRLATQPDPDFALEYSDTLLDELYRLTYGQPYLIQRLCWEMVNHWNERFLEQGESTPRTLEVEDLERVLTADLFAAADYYFDGVWSNVTEAEQVLMVAMASREALWTMGELSQLEGVSNSLEDTLDLLQRHDVILRQNGEVRFASELMRRWVADRESENA